MLTRHVANAARVVMLGGSTKDVFYFPEGTINVTAVDPDLSISLFEQAGMTAGVPVSAVKATALAHLRSLPAASVESVVAINKLKGGREAEEVVIEGYRVLKPGGTFVFINQVDGGAFASLLRLGGRNSSAGDEYLDSSACLKFP